MNSRKFSTIVFDLGNVLINVNNNLIFRQLDEIEPGLGKYYSKFYYAERDVRKKYEAGLIGDDEFINENLKLLNGKINGEKFCQIFSNIFTVNKNVVQLLPQLKEKYRLVLLSNTNNIHKKYGWEKYPFLKYFDKLILSHEIGALKPEEKIYRTVEKFTEEPSQTHIFIDDIKEFIDAAKMLGWGGIQFKGYENLLKELETKNII